MKLRGFDLDSDDKLSCISLDTSIYVRRTRKKSFWKESEKLEILETNDEKIEKAGLSLSMLKKFDLEHGGGIEEKMRQI